MSIDVNVVAERIAQAFVASGLQEDVVRDIAFHMTDWTQDLNDLTRLYERQQDLSDEQIRQTIIRFLAHVPNHVAAAKKLIGLGPIEDVFGVGVLEEDAD
jgi:hypothetical protein